MKFQYTLWAVLSCYLAVGCMTPKTNGNRKQKGNLGQSTRDKVGSKSIADEKLSANYLSRDQQLIQFITTQSDRQTALTSADTALFETLPPSPPENSLEEAALVIGVLKKCLQGYVENKNYEEANLYNENSQSNVAADYQQSALKKISLEKRMQQKGVDLGKALTSNALLRTYEVYSLALQLSRQTSNSPKFMNEVAATVNAQVLAWTNLPSVGTFVGKTPSPPEAAAAPESSTSNNANSNAAAINANVANEANPNDAILIEAQNLADNKRFAEAIKKAGQIEKSNPLYATAQAKIVSFSNDAVQELRQKAALAFQNALPVSDPKAKASYLNMARKHLEQALDKYPLAPPDQLKTVRENLSVISKDLERLSATSETDQKAQLSR